MANEILKAAAKKSGVRMWQIAEEISTPEASFSRKLRHELPEAERDKLLEIINQIAARRGEANGL